MEFFGHISGSDRTRRLEFHQRRGTCRGPAGLAGQAPLHNEPFSLSSRARRGLNRSETGVTPLRGGAIPGPAYFPAYQRQCIHHDEYFFALQEWNTIDRQRSTSPEAPLKLSRPAGCGRGGQLVLSSGFGGRRSLDTPLTLRSHALHSEVDSEGPDIILNFPLWLSPHASW